ncbi:MAG: peptidoglycan-associated lipoprotein Pal [Pseudomonadota bacterium]
MQNVVTSGFTAAVLMIGFGACATPPEEPAPPPVVEEVAEAPPAPPPVIEEAPAAPVGPAAGSIEDFRVNVGERVYFDLDQWRLDDSDKAVLQRQAAWLQSYPNVRILVAGNCDERGTREYNLALGERRASIVRDYLVGLGVDQARIETVSYGKERPIDGGSNEAAWALNRNGFTQIVSGARTT